MTIYGLLPSVHVVSDSMIPPTVVPEFACTNSDNVEEGMVRQTTKISEHTVAGVNCFTTTPFLTTQFRPNK